MRGWVRFARCCGCCGCSGPILSFDRFGMGRYVRHITVASSRGLQALESLGRIGGPRLVEVFPCPYYLCAELCVFNLPFFPRFLSPTLWNLFFHPSKTFYFHPAPCHFHFVACFFHPSPCFFTLHPFFFTFNPFFSTLRR